MLNQKVYAAKFNQQEILKKLEEIHNLELDYKKQEENKVKSNLKKVQEQYKDNLSFKELKKTFEKFDGERENLGILKRWIYNLYFYYNKKYFKEDLKLPTVNVGSLKGKKSKALAFWDDKKRILHINSILFNSSFNQIENTLLHEMCHQAADEISDQSQKYKIGFLNGHDTEWAEWMKKCGLSPDRFYTGTPDNFIYKKNIKSPDSIIGTNRDISYKELSMEHLQKKYAWNKVQTNLAKSMMLAGANEEAIEKLVRGYGNKIQQADLSLACPKCHATMAVASLEDGRKTRYCKNDRICLPLK